MLGGKNTKNSQHNSRSRLHVELPVQEQLVQKRARKRERERQIVADCGRQDRTASKIQRAHERDSSKSRSIGGTRRPRPPAPVQDRDHVLRGPRCPLVFSNALWGGAGGRANCQTATLCVTETRVYVIRTHTMHLKCCLPPTPTHHFASRSGLTPPDGLPTPRNTDYRREAAERQLVRF